MVMGECRCELRCTAGCIERRNRVRQACLKLAIVIVIGAVSLLGLAGTKSYAQQIEAAFQADIGNPWLWSSPASGPGDIKLGMMAGTSPSIGVLPDGTVEVAFQANTGSLWLWTSGGGPAGDLKLGMMAGTSPSLAVMPNGTVEIAFQANTGSLWLWTSGGGPGGDLKLGMMAGTSPSVAVMPDSTVEVGFQANTGSLWLWSSGGGPGGDLKLGMMAGTSPSVAVMPNGTTVEVGFQANTGSLWLWSSGGGPGGDIKLGMLAGTSPSVAVLPDSTVEIAFQANTGSLWLWTSGGGPAGDLQLGMMKGTSPSLAVLPDSAVEIGFQADTGSLWLWKSASGAGVAGDLKLGMMAGSSPSIAAPAPATTTTQSCGVTDNCTPQTFADAILNYSGVNAPVTAANEYALEVWEEAEGGGAGCTSAQPANTAPWAYSPGPAGNPLNTTQTEPGSTSWNSAGVQVFHDGDGNTCWGWGIKANGDVLTTAGDSNGLYYTPILNVLKNPSSDNYTQCVNLAQAVGDTPWGTGNFGGDCQ
jgi:hypothetical protein